MDIKNLQFKLNDLRSNNNDIILSETIPLIKLFDIEQQYEEVNERNISVTVYHESHIIVICNKKEIMSLLKKEFNAFVFDNILYTFKMHLCELNVNGETKLCLDIVSNKALDM